MLWLDEPVSRTSPSLKREVEKEDLNLRGAIDRIVLSHAIEELPRGCRQIFELHEVEGYQHHEIAELLQCSIGNSKSQLHKAKLKMRDLLLPARRVPRTHKASDQAENMAKSLAASDQSKSSTSYSAQ